MGHRPPSSGTAAHRRSAAAACFACAAALLGSAAAGGAPPLPILSDRSLGAEHRYVYDVRWQGRDTVLVAKGKKGIVELSLTDRAAVRTIVPEDGGIGSSAVRLALSPTHLVTAFFIRTIGWRARGEEKLRTHGSIELISDLDVKGDRLLVMGLRGREGQKLPRDGVIAWTGSLSRDLADLKPAFFADPDAAVHMDACAMFDLGAVRFLRDGSYLVVPGVLPGVARYGPGGGLRQAWDGPRIGIDEGCPISGRADEKHRFAIDHQLRHTDFLNLRRVVDDVLELPHGPALVVRSVAAGTTRWELKLLRDDGTATAVRIPITSSSPFARLKADVDAEGRRIAFVTVVMGPEETPSPPRLVVTGVPQLSSRPAR